MSKLTDLKAQGKMVKCGEMEFELKPLDFDSLVQYGIYQADGKAKEAIMFMVSKSLKLSIPDATDDEINHLSPQHMNTIVTAILDLNGLEEKKKESGSTPKN